MINSIRWKYLLCLCNLSWILHTNWSSNSWHASLVFDSFPQSTSTKGISQQIWWGSYVNAYIFKGMCLQKCDQGIWFSCCSDVQLRGCGSVSVNCEWRDLHPRILTPPKVVDAFIHETTEQFSQRIVSFNISNQSRMTVTAGELIECQRAGKTFSMLGHLAYSMLIYVKEMLSTVSRYLI